MKFFSTITIIMIGLTTAAQANAQNYWIPAEKFENHTNLALEGSIVEDSNFGGKATLILDKGEQVRVIVGADQGLADYVNTNPVFEVCAFVANAESGQTNVVRAKHSDPTKSQKHTLDDEKYRMVCSESAPIDYGNLLSSGVKVLSPSQGSVKVRGLSFRSTPVQENSGPSLSDYEVSRTLGYLWGDGGIATDGISSYFRKSKNSVSKHFESVATAAFADALEVNPQGTRFNVRLEDQTVQDFFANGPNSIPDPRAFLTSVIEGEGAVLVGRITDDPNRSRCDFLKNLVDDLNPECSAQTCTDSSCAVPNCAFVASGSKRGKPAKAQGFCGVYLSGKSSDWAKMLNTDAYHFVKCDRTPGGVCTQHPTDSRPRTE